MDQGNSFRKGPFKGQVSEVCVSAKKRTISPEPMLLDETKKTKPDPRVAEPGTDSALPAADAILDSASQPDSVAFGPEPRLKHRRHPAFFWKDRPAPSRTPDCLTVILRPVTGTLHDVKFLHLGRAFAGLDTEPVAVRKIKNGGFAMDFPKTTDLTKILETKTFANIDVTAQLPHARSGTWGTVRANYESAGQFLQMYEFHLEKNPKITDVRRLGKSNVFACHFLDTSLPDSVMVCYERLEVRPYYQQPLRCYRCQRYGHVVASCRGPEHCSKCGRQNHSFQDCPATEPWCVNCGGAHEAVSRTCPHHQFESKVNREVVKTGGSKAEIRRMFAIAFAAEFQKRRGQAPTSYSSAVLSTLKPTTSYSSAVASPAKPKPSKSDASTQCTMEPARVTGTQTSTEIKKKTTAPTRKDKTDRTYMPTKIYKNLQDTIDRVMSQGDKPGFNVGMLQESVLDLFQVLNKAQDFFEGLSDTD